MTSISDLRKKLEKKFKDSTELFPDFGVIKKINTVPSGSAIVDAVTCVGGFPRGRVTEIFGGYSSGKLCPLDEPVLACKRNDSDNLEGFEDLKWVPHGELKVGDLVATPDGLLSSIYGVYPQGVKQVYHILFSDGSTFRCGLEHLCPVEIDSYTNPEFPYEVYSLEKILYLFNRGHSCRVPLLTVPPEIGKESFKSESEGSVDPYILGLVLGDGGVQEDKVYYSTTDNKLADAVLKAGFKELKPQIVEGRIFALNAAEHKTDWDRWSILGLIGCTSVNKFIPESYKNAPVRIRLGLLQGLLDTDGCVSIEGTTIEFLSKSKQLAEDVQYIVRSLGGWALRKEKWVVPPGHTEPELYHGVYIRISNIPLFRLSRKIARERYDMRGRLSKEIESIEAEGEEETLCIKIAHPMGLYISRDFTLTHNTTMAITACAALQAQAKRAKSKACILYLDYEHAFDASYARKLGLDMSGDSFIFAQPDYFEQGDEIIDMFVTDDVVDFIIIDSSAAMTPRDELEGKIDGSQRLGLQASLASKMLARLTKKINKGRRPALLSLNQTRAKIDLKNPRNSGEDAAGGNAWRFYSSIRLKLEIVTSEGAEYRGASSVTDQLYTRNKVRVVAVKNKVAPPFMRGSLFMDYGRGVNNIASIAELAELKLGIMAGAGFFSYKGDTPETSFTFRGRENFVKLLEDSKPTYLEMERKVLAALRAEQSALLGLDNIVEGGWAKGEEEEIESEVLDLSYDENGVPVEEVK